MQICHIFTSFHYKGIDIVDLKEIIETITHMISQGKSVQAIAP